MHCNGMSGRVLCMGAANLDLVMFMEHFPQTGEVVTTDNFHRFPGGKGGNQAVAASLLGAQVTFFGKLGDDEASQTLINSLDMNKVNTRHILRAAGQTAGITMIRVDARGQYSISYSPGANMLITAKEVRENAHLFMPGDILLISIEINLEASYEAIRIAHEKGMFVILDPSPVPKDNIPEEICEMIDIIKPNESEASLIAGILVKDMESARQALIKLHARGCKNSVITLGEQGAAAYIDQRFITLPPEKVKAVDTTAAGDVFSGALAAHISGGNDIFVSLQFASHAAAVSTTVKGAQTSIPSLAQLHNNG